jgi:hypothetical protein
MATILIFSFTDLQRDPGVYLQIEALRTYLTTIAAGPGDSELALYVSSFTSITLEGC